MAKEEEWDARCRAWEPGNYLGMRGAVGAVGGKKMSMEAMEGRTRESEGRTRGLEAKRRRLEVERWELAPRTAAVREEFQRDLGRATGRVLYGQGRGGY